MKETQTIGRNEYYKALDNANILQIRLNSDYVLQRVKIMLSGEIESIVYDKEGNPVVTREQITQPLANKFGIQSILNYVENVINPQTVQGNFTEAQYSFFISELHDGLLTEMMNNLYNWGIQEDNYEHICNSIMNLVQPFVSRLINNKERDSYAQSIRVAESNTLQVPKKSLFSRE